MKLGQKLPSCMETGFSAYAEDFKPEGFKMFLKKNLISKPKFLEQILKCSGICRSKLVSVHGKIILCKKKSSSFMEI